MPPIAIGLLKLLAAFGLVLANGYFVVAEFALVSVRRSRIEALEAQGDALAGTVRHIIDDTVRSIGATQLGITLSSLSLGWLGEETIAHLLEPLLEHLPSFLRAVSSVAVASGLAFAIITFMHVVVGELAPKSIALQYPEQASFAVARSMVVVEAVFRPFTWLLNGAGNGLLKMVGLRAPSGHELVHSVDELKLLVDQSLRGGVVDEEEMKIATRAFEFGDREAREAMVPRNEVVGVERTSTVDDVLLIFGKYQHSRFPVYEDDLDHIVGVVSMKDIMAALVIDNDNRQKRLAEMDLVRPLLVVPETAALGQTFADMRAKQLQMALIVDEYGGTAGLVTAELLSEEVMGSLMDEWVDDDPPVQELKDAAYRVNAQLQVSEVNEELGLSLPELDIYETLAGFLLYMFGRIPAVSDVVTHAGLRFEVTRMHGPKIEEVRVERL